MDYRKYFKEKLLDLFDDKLKYLEKKAMEDLKEIEIMKYELNDIYEGIKTKNIYFINKIDNQDDTIIDNLKNKKLFYTYFDEEKIIELEIENTNNFSIQAPKKEPIVKSNNESVNKHNNLKNHQKTPTLSFNQIKSLEEMLRQKESLLRNKQNNNSNTLIYNNYIPQTYRTISNNIPEKFLTNNNTQSHLYSQYNSNYKINDFNNKNLNSKNYNPLSNNTKSTNLKSNKQTILSNSPKEKKTEEKFKIKIDSLNNISNYSEAILKKTKNFTTKNNKESTLQKCINEYHNNTNKTINGIGATNKANNLSNKSNNTNKKEYITENLNLELENSLNENNIIYNSLSPNGERITSNFCDNIKEKVNVLENLGPSNFLNNINININNLNNPENLEIKANTTKIDNFINVKKQINEKNILKKKSADTNEILDNSRNYNSDYNESKISLCENSSKYLDNNFHNNNLIDELKNFKNENSDEENEINDQIIEKNTKNGYYSQLDKNNFFSPNDKKTTKNFINYANYNSSSNQTKNNNIFKSITNKNKIKTNSLTLQDVINKKLQNYSNNNINNKNKDSNNNQMTNNLHLSQNLSNILEHSFSNIINVNVNVENENKYLSEKPKKKSNKFLFNIESQYDKNIFNHINAVRAESSLNNFNNKKPISNNLGKINTNHKKTQSLNHTNFVYNTNNNNLNSNKILNSNEKIDANKSSKIKKLNINNKKTINYTSRKDSTEDKLFIETPRSKSKTGKILNDLSPDKNIYSNKEFLNTTKAGYHKVTKSQNNLDFLKVDKSKTISKEYEIKDNSNNIFKKEKERKVNKSSSKLNGKVQKIDKNSRSKVIRESSLEIKTNLSVEDLELNKKNSKINCFDPNITIGNLMDNKSRNNNDKNDHAFQTTSKSTNKFEDKIITNVDDKDAKEIDKKDSDRKSSEINISLKNLKHSNSHINQNISNGNTSKIIRNNSIFSTKENPNVAKTNYRHSQITNSKNKLIKNHLIQDNNDNNIEDLIEGREKSHSAISMINPRKVLSKNNIFSNKEESINIRKKSSCANFNNENEDIPHFPENFQDNFDLKQFINQNQMNTYQLNNNEQEVINNLSHHSIHSITSMGNFTSKEKEKFHEDINKTIEKEIKRDSLINDINISINSKENIEGKKYSDMINNIFLDDNILNTNNTNETKSIDTEERKMNTPKFSPLNLYNGKKFDFNKQDQEKKFGVLILLIQSGFLPLSKTLNLIGGCKILLENKDLIHKVKIKYLIDKINSKTKFITDKLGDKNLEKLAEPFIASKISKNGLSLFTKNEENELKTKDQPIEIINFFKFVSLIFDNKFLEFENDLEYIKLFFEKFLNENANLNEHFNKLIKFVEENPDVIQSSSLLRKNRSCSYISFIIKEIYEYYALKSPDDFPVYKLRNEFYEIQNLKNELVKIYPEYQKNSNNPNNNIIEKNLTNQVQEL